MNASQNFPYEEASDEDWAYYTEAAYAADESFVADHIFLAEAVLLFDQEIKGELRR